MLTETISDIRKRAWITRRAKHGPSGHGGVHPRSRSRCGDPARMLALIIRLHNEGALSEGQVARATGLHRIRVRELADEAKSKAAGRRALAEQAGGGK